MIDSRGGHPGSADTATPRVRVARAPISIVLLQYSYGLTNVCERVGRSHVFNFNKVSDYSGWDLGGPT